MPSGRSKKTKFTPPPNTIVFSAELPKTHNALSQPEEWNGQWEMLCQNPALNASMCLLAKIQATTGDDEEYASFSSLFATTCEVQSRIGRCATVCFAHRDFEARWTQTTVETRRKHALIALSEACSMARNLNDARLYCGDVLTLNHLCEDPRVLIDLVKSIIPEDITVTPKMPAYMLNDEWKTLREQGEKNTRRTAHERLCLEEILILRTKLICESLLTQQPLLNAHRFCCRIYDVLFLRRKTSQSDGRKNSQASASFQPDP